MGEFEVLGQRLKILRKRLGMNQSKFAETINISPATLSAYETGVKNPSIGVLKLIAQTCHVSIDWLCGLSDKETIEENAVLKTYSDIIRRLIEIEGYIKVECNVGNLETGKLVGQLLFYDSKVKSFLKDWSNMIKLHSSGTIDDNLYSLWIKQQLELYNVEILKPFRTKKEDK